MRQRVLREAVEHVRRASLVRADDEHRWQAPHDLVLCEGSARDSRLAPAERLVRGGQIRRAVDEALRPVARQRWRREFAELGASSPEHVGQAREFGRHVVEGGAGRQRVAVAGIRQRGRGRGERRPLPKRHRHARRRAAAELYPVDTYPIQIECDRAPSACAEAESRYKLQLDEAWPSAWLEL